MSATRPLINKALQLKPAERFIVIEALINSLDIPNPQIEKAWAHEAEKRLKDYKSGKIQTISFEDMFGKEIS
ncbi:MAG: addiction module protein [Elusimicrobiota bacterium]